MIITLDDRIKSCLAGGKAKAPEELARELRHSNAFHVNAALNRLVTRKEVERDGISNRFRLPKSK